MILHALYDYYQRKAATSAVPIYGWEWKEIPYLIVLTAQGQFATIEETREGKRAKKFLVPQSVRRTVGIEANLLWDNIEYALGANPRNRDDVQERHSAFRSRIERELSPLQIVSINILLHFLDSQPLQQIENSSCADLWQKMLEENPFVTFRIQGHNHTTICDDIVGRWRPREEGDESICLITGRRAVPARLHPAIKGVRGANANGASLVSFNDPAFCSYGKEQSYNSPVSGEAAFAYTTALNILLDRDSPNKVTLGESVTIVYWSDGASAQEYDFESYFGAYLDAPRDNPDQGVEAVRALYDAICNGKLTPTDQHFYVLGLAPNAGRIAVRFFRHGPTYTFARNIYQHFEDLQIVHGPNEPEYLPLYRLLASTAVEHKIDNVPSNLPSAVIESILDGTLYPLSLLQACIRRVRAEYVNRDKTAVKYEHAAILKAWLNRYHRLYHNLPKEITMTLDTTNTAPAYVLGRLFAVLERIQESAQPGINATIRERFYGAASASPAATFPRLLKLANHHLAKIENPGLRVSLDKQLGEVMSLIEGFPLTFPLHDQALFALGYYHQRQAFFTPKQSSTEQTQQQDSVS